MATAGIVEGEGPRGGAHVHNRALVAHVLEERGSRVEHIAEGDGKVAAATLCGDKSIPAQGGETLGGEYDAITKFVIEARGDQDW